MGSAARYWQQVRLKIGGSAREEVPAAKRFFQNQFPELVGDVPDAQIQRQLLEIWRDERVAASDRHLAEICLRCYISNQIEQVCLQLESQFGREHGFKHYDLFAYVLDDDLRSSERSSRVASAPATVYRSLSSEILQTFDPSRASLSTWVIRLVRHHRELNAFLLEQGVYLVSDWAILNDTTVKQVRRILAEFHACTPVEIEQSCQLLQAYHLVYRQDRLQHRKAGGGSGHCSLPTPEQLQRMAQILRKSSPGLQQPEQTSHLQWILSQLQELATQLRQYRISVRGHKLPSDSLDHADASDRSVEIRAPEPNEADREQNEFLTFYREQFLGCLQEGVQQVLEIRLAPLLRKKPETARQFLKAMYLFHCQRQAMGEIAVQIGLQAQYQVSRLMKLKEFRADIRQQVLVMLSDRIRSLAQEYIDPNRLPLLDQQLQAALDEQISTVMQQAEAEASIAKNRPLNSLFAQTLCHHLETRRLEP
jgi:hypothetical protein